MRTIAVIALKGGSGKTTVATHLALAAHLRGLNALVVDVDPQRSASEILNAREGAGPGYISAEGGQLLAAQMAAVTSGADLMVIDTAAGAVEDVGMAVALADLCLLVVRPTLLDLAAAVRTVDITRRLRKPTLAVVNQAPVPRGGVEAPIVKRALRALDFMRLTTAPTLLRSRIIYQTALETGRSVEEADDAAAAGEIRALWEAVEGFSVEEVEPAVGAG
jgi:chromosome partitioning protein